MVTARMLTVMPAEHLRKVARDPLFVRLATIRERQNSVLDLTQICRNPITLRPAPPRSTPKQMEGKQVRSP